MITLFFVVFFLAVLTELLKGLSANGTPPVLQRFSWQMDLAHFLWSNILYFRIAFIVLLVIIAIQIPTGAGAGWIFGAVVLAALWGFVYWLFNRYWVGRFKFLPITQKVFAGAADNKVDPSIQVLGVDHGGEQKAFPVNMLFYHHQIADEIAGHPIWPTYCGLCRSGRVYDILVDGEALEFTLVGAITYNAVFRDHRTGSWWRQETGEAAKGPLKGQVLEDMPFEQMSLGNWLAKYPDSKVLQYDPVFERKYNFTAGLLNYEVSLPGWHMQSTPPLVLGVEVGDHARGYDWNELAKHRVVQDEVNGSPVLVVCDEEGSSAFAYERSADGSPLSFELKDNQLVDSETGSVWDQFGRCIKGKMKGKSLPQIQSYKQYVRAWLSFHPHTTFYNF